MSIVDEMDVIFKDEGKFIKVVFNSSKAVDAANARFPKQLDIVDDTFAVTIAKSGKLPMKKWCDSLNLKSFDF